MILCCLQSIFTLTMTSSVLNDVTSVWRLGTDCITESDGSDSGCVLCSSSCYWTDEYRSTVQCSTVHCSAVEYSIVQCSTIIE